MGYQTKDTIQGMNYVTPTFRPITEGSTLSIQDMQLDDSVANGHANFQRLNYLGGSACFYYWYTKAGAETLGLTVPDGVNGVWVLTTTTGSGRNAVTTYSLPSGDDDVVETGDGIQIYMADADKVMTFAGIVDDADMVQTSIVGMNYIGNPFPQNCSVQDFQLDNTVANGHANFQRLNYLGGSGCLYYWYTKAGAETLGLTVPNGLDGVWVLTTTTGSGRNAVTTYSLPSGNDDVVAPADGLQIYTAEAGKIISVLCPYELN